MADRAYPPHGDPLRLKLEFETLDAGTRAYYDAHAIEYAIETHGLRPADIWDLVERHVPVGSRLLDLGCGAGRDLYHFVQAGYAPLGVERSAILAGVARLQSGCEVLVTDFRALPLQAPVFGGVYAVASLLHLVPDVLVRIMCECRELLVPGGMFVASVKEGCGTEVDTRGRFVAYYQDPWLHAAAKDAGFSAVRVLHNEERRQTETVRWLTVVGFAPSNLETVLQ